MTALMIALSATAFNLVVTLLRSAGARAQFVHTLHVAVVRAAQYAAVIGVLEVIAHYDASLAGWADGAMGVIALTELVAGLAASDTGVQPPPKL
jgi:uncharacterized membrane protein